MECTAVLRVSDFLPLLPVFVWLVWLLDGLLVDLGNKFVTKIFLADGNFSLQKRGLGLHQGSDQLLVRRAALKNHIFRGAPNRKLVRVQLLQVRRIAVWLLVISLHSVIKLLVLCDYSLDIRHLQRIVVWLLLKRAPGAMLLELIIGAGHRVELLLSGWLLLLLSGWLLLQIAAVLHKVDQSVAVLHVLKSELTLFCPIREWVLLAAASCISTALHGLVCNCTQRVRLLTGLHLRGFVDKFIVVDVKFLGVQHIGLHIAVARVAQSADLQCLQLFVARLALIAEGCVYLITSWLQLVLCCFLRIRLRWDPLLSFSGMLFSFT